MPPDAPRHDGEYHSHRGEGPGAPKTVQNRADAAGLVEVQAMRGEERSAGHVIGLGDVPGESVEDDEGRAPKHETGNQIETAFGPPTYPGKNQGLPFHIPEEDQSKRSRGDESSEKKADAWMSAPRAGPRHPNRVDASRTCC